MHQLYYTRDLYATRFMGQDTSLDGGRAPEGRHPMTVLLTE